MKNDKSLKFLSVDETIEKAKTQGVDFGTGKPYNRLRYYTKLGWIPHMERKGPNVQGHYPNWVIGRLKFIQELKDKGYSNDEITEEIEKQKKLQTILKPLKNEKLKRKLLIIGVVSLILLIVFSELDIIRIGSSKRNIIPQQRPTGTIFP